MAKSVALKCTYNDGGEGTYVGFSDTCSKDNIKRNIKSHVSWCSEARCACRQYYDNGIEYPIPKELCYESRLFVDWKFGAGYDHKDGKNKPRHMRQVGEGNFAILTTRFPRDQERDRKIIGLFKIGEIHDTDETETMLHADAQGRIQLPLEEAKELYFWAYHRNKRPDNLQWRSGLFRYLEDGQVHRILADVAETVRDENTKTIIRRLIEENFGNTEPPPANGSLPDKSINRLNEIIRERKYGPGGEGPEHKRLKEFIAGHPEEIGLKNIEDYEFEHVFKSLDSADLLFTQKDNRYTVVEIKTIGFQDILRGAHQAIKYRALLCAELGVRLGSDKVKAVLVAWEKPDEVDTFCKKYGIGFEKVKL